MRITLFLVVVALLLLGGTYLTRKTRTSVGAYNTTTYGWPEPWVYIHEIGGTTEWSIDWKAMAIPGTVVFCTATMGLMLLWLVRSGDSKTHTE